MRIRLDETKIEKALEFTAEEDRDTGLKVLEYGASHYYSKLTKAKISDGIMARYSNEKEETIHNLIESFAQRGVFIDDLSSRAGKGKSTHNYKISSRYITKELSRKEKENGKNN